MEGPPIRYFVETSVALMGATQIDLANGLPDRTPDDPPRLIQAILLAECMGQHIAIRSCIKEAVISPGFMIARSLVTNTSALVHMSRNPDTESELALSWYCDKTKRQRKLVAQNAQIHRRDASAQLRELDAEIARVEEMIREKSGRTEIDPFPSLGEMSDVFGSVAVAQNAIDVLSQYVHSGIDSVVGRVIGSPDAAGVFTPRDHSPSRVVQCASLADAAMFDAAIAVGRLHNWESTELLSATAAERAQTFAELRESAERSE